MQRAVLFTMVALVALSGCHARFKKYAPTLGAVRPQVVQTGGVSVQLPDTNSALVDVVNGVRGIDAAQKLSRQVNVEKVNLRFTDGLHETLQDGPPFGLTDKPDAPTLQVDVTNYGLYIPTLGGQGEFVYDLDVHIYLPDGYRVYHTGLRCSSPITGADAISQVLGTRDNLGNVLDMRKKEIQGAFEGAGYDCGEALTLLMRKHAS